MQPRPRKRQTPDYLEISLQLFVDRVSLRLDRQACIKCDICALVCPQQAVSIFADERRLEIDIDPRACLLCEVCAHFCPVGAITLSYNDQPKAVLDAGRALAPFFPKVSVDPTKCPEPCRTTPAGEVHWCRHELKLVENTAAGCPKSCRRCLDACRRQALELDADARQVVAQADLCLRCTQCLEVCAFGGLEVNPQFLGTLDLDDSLCPADCTKCIDLCPVQALAREGARVFRRAEHCSLCGVCVNICDQGAITLRRQEVVATAGEFSHAWRQAVARLLGEAP